MGRTYIRVAIAAVVLSGWVIAPLVAQQPRPASTAQTPEPAQSTDQAKETRPDTGVLLRVDVVIRRVQGDKTIASLPYTLFGSLGQSTSLRLGQKVPVVTGSATEVPSTVSYQDVGTNIDFSNAALRPDGRYEYHLNLSANYFYASPDSSGATTPSHTSQPVFGNYSVSNFLISRDGQPLTFSVATDRVTGETLRAEVTVTAVK